MEHTKTAAALVLRKRDLCKLLGISPATLDRQRVRGEFPTPIKLGEQAVGWTMASVQAWIDSRPLAHHFNEAVYIEEDGDDAHPGMEQYPREQFAAFIESMLRRLASHPSVAAKLTIEEIALLCAFPEQIRAHRSPIIYARPTDRIVDLMKSGKIGPTWPAPKHQVSESNTCK